MQLCIELMEMIKLYSPNGIIVQRNASEKNLFDNFGRSYLILF